MTAPYVLKDEEHVGRPIMRPDESTARPGIRFGWAIRRADGSLLFRFESAKDAYQCLDNLFASVPA